jgi:hypothetical protein
VRPAYRMMVTMKTSCENYFEGTLDLPIRKQKIKVGALCGKWMFLQKSRVFFSLETRSAVTSYG